MKITLKNYLESVKYQIHEGFEYQWKCFGNKVFALNTEKSKKNKFYYSTQVVFDTKNQTVYEVSFWDYIDRRVYRWVSPKFIKKFLNEYKKRGLNPLIASDEMRYEDISFSSIISKIKKKVK